MRTLGPHKLRGSGARDIGTHENIHALSLAECLAYSQMTWLESRGGLMMWTLGPPRIDSHVLLLRYTRTYMHSRHGS